MGPELDGALGDSYSLPGIFLWCFLCVSQGMRGRRRPGAPESEPALLVLCIYRGWMTCALQCPALGTQHIPQCPEVRESHTSAKQPLSMAVLHEPSHSSFHRGGSWRPSLSNALLVLPRGPGWRRNPRCRVLSWHQRQSCGQCWGTTRAEPAAVGSGLVQESQQL